MQDWNYRNTGNMEITVELSFVKYPPANQLAQYWQDNRASLYAYTEVVRRWGVRGRVSGVASAVIQVASHDSTTNTYTDIAHNVTSTPQGMYYRLLAQGQYRVTCTPPDKPAKTAYITIPPSQLAPVIQDFVF